jgi:tRNA 2-thiouridine synthesizing protein A
MVKAMQSDLSKTDSPDAGLTADVELNLTGMKCPLPVLKARRQINQMAPRAVLKVTADDPAAPLDFEHFCDTGGHALLSSREQAGIFTFYIAKSPD